MVTYLIMSLLESYYILILVQDGNQNHYIGDLTELPFCKVTYSKYGVPPKMFLTNSIIIITISCFIYPNLPYITILPFCP
jgi:hypothetical protein